MKGRGIRTSNEQTQTWRIQNGTGRTSNSPKHDEIANGNGEDKEKKKNTGLKTENGGRDAKLPLTKHGKVSIQHRPTGGHQQQKHDD